jgi:hypothetical protein
VKTKNAPRDWAQGRNENQNLLIPGDSTSVELGDEQTFSEQSPKEEELKLNLLSAPVQRTDRKPLTLTKLLFLASTLMLRPTTFPRAPNPNGPTPGARSAGVLE